MGGSIGRASNHIAYDSKKLETQLQPKGSQHLAEDLVIKLKQELSIVKQELFISQRSDLEKAKAIEQQRAEIAKLMQENTNLKAQLRQSNIQVNQTPTRVQEGRGHTGAAVEINRD